MAPAPPTEPFAMPPAQYDAAKAKALVKDVCTQCHELDELDQHGGDDVNGWAKVTRDMVAEGAEIDVETGRIIVQLLAAERPKK